MDKGMKLLRQATAALPSLSNPPLSAEKNKKLLRHDNENADDPHVVNDKEDHVYAKTFHLLSRLGMIPAQIAASAFVDSGRHRVRIQIR